MLQKMPYKMPGPPLTSGSSAQHSGMRLMTTYLTSGSSAQHSGMRLMTTSGTSTSTWWLLIALQMSRSSSRLGRISASPGSGFLTLHKKKRSVSTHSTHSDVAQQLQVGSHQRLTCVRVLNPTHKERSMSTSILYRCHAAAPGWDASAPLPHQGSSPYKERSVSTGTGTHSTHQAWRRSSNSKLGPLIGGSPWAWEFLHEVKEYIF